ncbi:uncharacterized protein LOC134260954 [Saccostrea cucullata]|uniref:uncharacterized protein LOC134260954 n=1 Tax=Saccostrea cuccullata TaxID=36930 RepID=UPI002ED4979A
MFLLLYLPFNTSIGELKSISAMQLWIHCAVICMFGISLHAWHVKILGTGSCLAASIEQVDWCPRTKYDWELQARRKNCSNIVLPCFKYNLLYHCLINTWQNRMYSVCAAPDNILGIYIFHICTLSQRKKLKRRDLRIMFTTKCNFSKYITTERILNHKIKSLIYFTQTMEI